ncbi:MAG: hypothetical protein IT360_17980 [Gemmatimonadaceae bacterium]|nr:hypothetical protein [Gemmatimonadaceae bacterium]
MPAAAVRSVPLATARALAENSSAAASVASPGVAFSVNDSGNDAVLFAFDTTGADRGRWRLQGATNRDWEAVAVARCDPEGAAWCVFVGDVGDTAGERAHVTIYRVPEPAPIGAGEQGTLVPDVLRVRYDDHQHNVESLVVAPDGSLLLVTKEAARASKGRIRPTMVYRVSPPHWGSDTAAAAALVDSLPIVPGAAPGQSVTDAALVPGGRALAVRTNRMLFVFAVDSATARPISGRLPAMCDLSALREAQGEGVGFLHDAEGNGGRFVLTTEGKRESLRMVTCPLPPR